MSFFEFYFMLIVVLSYFIHSHFKQIIVGKEVFWSYNKYELRIFDLCLIKHLCLESSQLKSNYTKLGLFSWWLRVVHSWNLILLDISWKFVIQSINKVICIFMFLLVCINNQNFHLFIFDSVKIIRHIIIYIFINLFHLFIQT